MKIQLNKNLFWFLKENTQLDMADPASLDMYVQHVICRGRAADIKTLLTLIDHNRLEQVFPRIKRFLPWEVKTFWEDFFADH